MDGTLARDWAQGFEGKEESEIPDRPPEGLPVSQLVPWKKAQQAAKQAARDRRAQSEAMVAQTEMALPAAPVADEPLPASRSERVKMLLDNMHEAEIRARERERDRVTAKHQPLVLPDGDAAQLLEQHIASSAALIRYLSDYVSRNDTDPHVCMSFMDRMTSMLGASANVGKVVGRLRGQASRTEQEIIVKRETRERVGEGVSQT